MNLKTIETQVQQVETAKENGIFSIHHGGSVHVTQELFKTLLQKVGNKYSVKSRACVEYPYRVEFEANGRTYFAIYDIEEFQSEFHKGGEAIEQAN